MKVIENIKKANAAGVVLKKLKSMNGHDGLIWSCDVYLGGIKLGDVLDDGNGGGLIFGIKACDVAALATALKGVDFPLNLESEWGSIDAPKNDFGYVEWILPIIADNLETLKKMKRSASKNTLYVLETDKNPENEYWVVKQLYSAEFAARLRAKHGTALTSILNELIVGL